MSLVQHLSAKQTAELSLLVNLEGRWENLRIHHPTTTGRPNTPTELHLRQKAYEAFSAKLLTYNKGFKPWHVPEQLLNNVRRLGPWCQKMSDLLHQGGADEQYPTHLLEKAYRWADRIADAAQRARIVRPTPASTIAAAVRELDDLSQWCGDLSITKLAS